MDELKTSKENLLKLIKAWQESEAVPIMDKFGNIDQYPIYLVKLGEVNECNSSCCALGYAPSIEGLEVKEEDFGFDEDEDEYLFCYEKYSARILPALEVRQYRWDYLFGSNWPNDRNAFIKRAKLMIDLDFEPTEEMREEYKNLHPF